MRHLRIAAALAAALALAGCATRVPLQQAQIGAITAQTSAGELDAILKNATQLAAFEFADGGRSFFVRSYSLQTGMRQDMTMVCTPVCIPIFITVPVTTDYVVVQNLPARTLHAWGTLEALSKDPDTAVSSIMPALKLRLQQESKPK
jgi:hypothetical protein